MLIKKFIHSDYSFQNIFQINKTKMNARALHYVFKIPDRKLTTKFYREILGMKVILLLIFIIISNKYIVII